jgi:addiction module HigA family antidote
MRLKLQTTTRSKGHPIPGVSAGTTMTTRMPKSRAPTHPGEMLLEEFLKPMAITQSDFAARLGVSFPRLNEIVRGRRGVTPDTALRLGRVLGMSAEFWLGLQLDWDLWNAMQGKQYAEIERLQPVKHGA